MIQRIQSVYLFIVAAVMALPSFIPIARIVTPEKSIFNFYTYGVEQTGTNEALTVYFWPLLVLSILSIGVPLVTIFLYKKQFLQFRLCVVEIVLLLGNLFLMWYHIQQFEGHVQAEVSYKFSFILPVACVILVYLAIRGILKDINLLKSYDRIR